MAKAAKAREVQVSAKVLKNIRAILDCYEHIETARGRFMVTSRTQRDRMTTLYEAMAAEGISQRAARINIKIDRALRKIEGWQADLEVEDRKMAAKIAKARDDRRQLAFWTDLPRTKRSETDKAPKLELVQPAAE